MRRTIAAVVVVLVAVASLVPGAGAGGTVAGVGLDKLLHVVGYAAVGGAVLWSASGDRRRRVAVALGVAVVLGAGLEVLQGVVPGRHPSLADLLADALGAVAGVVAVVIWEVRHEDAAGDGTG